MESVLQFLKVLVVVLLVILLMIVAGLVGTFVSDALGGPKPTQVSNVTYPAADGTPLVAYLNIPQVAGRPYPGIIMAPDRWGLDEAMLKLANLLAEQGYAVIVPDLYRGEASGALHRALYLTLTTPVERTLSDMQSAFDYLAAQNGVNADRMGVIGLGYGGGVALRYATRNPRVTAVVDAYGSVLTDPDALSRLGGPVQGLFAQDDPFVSDRQVEAFRAALDAADVPHDIQIYPNLSNSFFAYPQIGFPATGVRRIWNRDVVAFFNAQLKGIMPTLEPESTEAPSS